MPGANERLRNNEALKWHIIFNYQTLDYHKTSFAMQSKKEVLPRMIWKHFLSFVRSKFPHWLFME